MKTKQDIVENWLPRYTGQELKDFGEYIIICNFSNYVKMFADRHSVPIVGIDKQPYRRHCDGPALRYIP